MYRFCQTVSNPLLDKTQQKEAAKMVLEIISPQISNKEFLTRLQEKILPQGEEEGFEVERS